MPHVAERAPEGWKKSHEQKAVPPTPDDFVPSEDAELPDDSPDASAYRKAWVQRFAAGDIANPRLCAKHKTKGPLAIKGLRDRSNGLPKMRL